MQPGTAASRSRGGAVASVARVRPVPVAILVVVLLVSGMAPASPAPDNPVHEPVFIDASLLERLDVGPEPALLWWDRSQASRTEVAHYLESNGVDAYVFERLSGAVACLATADTVETMALAPGAVSVWGDEPLRPALDGSVPTAFDGDPDEVWSGLDVTGEGVGIAVLDTGVDGTHPDLEFGRRTKLNVRVLFSHQEVLGPSTHLCVPDQYIEQLADSEVTSGHGTHIASVAAGDGTASGGRYRGVAPGADIVGIGVADTITPQQKFDEGPYSEISLLGAIAGIDYVLFNALDGPVRVKALLAGWTQDDLFDPWHPMHWAIDSASWFGISVVFPAGNEGPEQSDCSAAETCHFNTWAAAPQSIAVAATPRRSRTDLESYSSRGDPVPRQARDREVRYEPTIAAPGTGVTAARRPGVAPYVQPPGSILGAGPGGAPVVFDRRYVGLTGTSVAAAHVAGAIALMQQAAVEAKGCYLTTQQVREILTSTATPMSGFGSWEVGAGALDVTSAIFAARTVTAVTSPDPWMCP